MTKRRLREFTPRGGPISKLVSARHAGKTDVRGRRPQFATKLALGRPLTQAPKPRTVRLRPNLSRFAAKCRPVFAMVGRFNQVLSEIDRSCADICQIWPMSAKFWPMAHLVDAGTPCWLILVPEASGRCWRQDPQFAAVFGAPGAVESPLGHSRKVPGESSLRLSSPNLAEIDPDSVIEDLKNTF